MVQQNPGLSDANVEETLVDCVQNLNCKQLAHNRNQRKILLQMFRLKHHKATVRSMANKLKVNRGTWARHSYPEKRTKIRKFGLRDGNASNFFKQHSSVAPDKKLVSKKTGEGAAFLQKSLKQLHNEYKEASGDSIPFSSFAKCRPKNVRLMSQAKLRQCLCEYCTNITLKLDTLKSFATRHRQYGCIINNERDAVRIITCDPKEKSCCYGFCDKCSVDDMDDHMFPLLTHQGDQVKWYRWENRMQKVKDKQVLVNFIFFYFL